VYATQPNGQQVALIGQNPSSTPVNLLTQLTKSPLDFVQQTFSGTLATGSPTTFVQQSSNAAAPLPMQTANLQNMFQLQPLMQNAAVSMQQVQPIAAAQPLTATQQAAVQASGNPYLQQNPAWQYMGGAAQAAPAASVPMVTNTPTPQVSTAVGDWFSSALASAAMTGIIG